MALAVCVAFGGLLLPLSLLIDLRASLYGVWLARPSSLSKELVIRNNTQMYTAWKDPPVVPHLRMYFFNVTNHKEFLENGDKPILQEVGPYCYREHWQKVNISFHDNGTVSYSTQRFYYFERSHSIGSEDDVIMTLNIPMVSAVNQIRFAARLVKLALSSMLDVLKEDPFAAHTVKELMWGYDDPLLKIAKEIMPPDQQMPFDEFGFFYNKNGSTDGLFNVWTGADDMTQYTEIENFNHEKSLSFWKTDECNDIKGSDGTSFPPDIKKESVLYMFNENFCRSIPLTFWHDIEKYGIKALRFTPSASVFGNVTVNPENDCYCVDGPPCSGTGLFNVSTCKFGSPVMLSWPHFYQADPKYLDAVVGLKPDPEKHSLFVDVTPRTGSPLGAEARLQINVATTRIPEIKKAANLQNMIFPVVWFEDGVTEMPNEIVELLQMASNVPEMMKSQIILAIFLDGALLIASMDTIL
ncbi:unnamed protein product, partial [Meganyctiphanes norvegica]